VPPRWLFVRVETADGFVGWGESTLEGHTEAIEGAFTDLAQRFLGWDADGIEDIWQTAYRARFYRGGPVLMVGAFLAYYSSKRMSGLVSAVWP
jgi:galactonate dehydratase